MNSLVQDRTRIAELNAEREVIRDAPLSRAETTSAITAWCAEQAGELETRIRYRVNQVAHGDDLQGLFVVQPMTPGGKIDMVRWSLHCSAPKPWRMPCAVGWIRTRG